MTDYYDNFGSFHGWLEAQLEFDPPKPAEVKVHHHRQPRVMCIGCYECRWWDNRNCTKPDEKFDPSICEWLSERAREKGE